MLHVLDPSNNSFSAIIPPSFSQFHRLKWLLLQQNNLSGLIPPRIGNISKLVGLNLSQNSLTGGVPLSLGSLHSLVYLDLSRNINLGGHIPIQIRNLKNLLVFSSFRNGHHGEIPIAICNFTNLLDLDLSENKLFGPLPQCIASLVVLRSLNVARNSLSGPIIPNFLNLFELESLQLSLNGFSGPIPQEIGNRLTRLRVLNLGDNRLSGSIPTSIVNLSLLATLDLNANFLRGTIPLAISQLSMLESINLGENPFDSSRGGLGEENGVLRALSNCSKLINIQLHHTNLSGTLPSSLAKLGKTLQYLELSGNSIKDKVPRSFGKFKYLVSLNLADNALQGELPASLSEMESLQYLNMTNNKFQGNLPKELVSINQSLTYLYLDGNRFSGSIPSFIGQLGNLRGLSLSRCGFTGVIPREVGNCVLLESLDLSGNNLTGEIPVEVGGLKNIYECFNLSSNSLNGSIPSAMGGMMLAECIDLSNNKLSGNITDQLSQWLSIKKLNLSFNRFEGILPDTLSQKLVALEEIDVSTNRFEGKVPELLLNITTVRFLNFSNNGFYGSITCPLKSFINASFQNNPHLCGNCWGLQPCPHNKSKRKTTMMVYIIVGGIVSFVSIIIWRLVLLEWKAPLEGTSEIEFSPPLSFRDLEKATDNFNPANLIGEGSYGCVYRGFLNGDDVAVKVFRDHDALTYESFAMECKTLGQVRHRNLLRIWGTCCTPNFKALVLPLMSNGSLANILHTPIDNQRLLYLSIKTRFEILHQLACGMSYLHNDCQPPILHCDIKPANVLLDRHMTVHLCDFGLAHLVGQRRIATEAKGKHLRVKGSMEFTATATQTLALKGTPGYVPPEYGMGSDLSSQGDVYSFGVVVLEILTRRRPTDPMFREGLTLRSWVWKEMQGNEAERKRWFLSIAHEEQLTENYIKTMEEMAKLGLLCTSPEINRRPTMKEVEGHCSTMSKRTSEMTAEYEWQKFCEMRKSGARQYAELLFPENQWQKF